jgi:hypothetical protein
MPVSIDPLEVDKSPRKKFNIKKLIKYTSVTDLSQNLNTSRYPLAEDISALNKGQGEFSPEKRQRSKTTSSLEMRNSSEEMGSSNAK